MTTVSATRYVACPFSATIEFAERALNVVVRRRIGLRAPFTELVQFRAKLTNDIADLTRGHDALLFAWQPEHRAFFPAFRGVMTVRPRELGSWLRITGSYEPTLGIFGKIFDVIAGRYVARRTLRGLLGEIASEIEATWAAERISEAV